MFKDLKVLRSINGVPAAGPIFIIIAALLWAFDGVIRRYLYELPPITIIFFEHLIGLIILLPFVYKKIFKTNFTKKEWGLLVLIAVLSGLLGTLWFTTALLKVHFISFSVVFLLQKLQPIFAITTARLFLKEKIEGRYIFWAILALVSAFFVTFPNGDINWVTGKGTIVAAIFALLAAVAWGSSTTFSKIALTQQNPKVITTLRFLLTTIMAFIAIFVLGKHTDFRLPVTSEFWRFFVIALSTGMVALLIYYKGLKSTPVRVATILELVFPVVAIFIDVILYDSVLLVSQYIAGAVLLFTMYRITVLQQKNEI